MSAQSTGLFTDTHPTEDQTRKIMDGLLLTLPLLGIVSRVINTDASSEGAFEIERYAVWVICGERGFSDIRGTHVRPAYLVGQVIDIPGTREEPPDSDFREICVCDSIPEAVTEAALQCARINIHAALEARAGASMFADMDDSEPFEEVDEDTALNDEPDGPCDFAWVQDPAISM